MAGERYPMVPEPLMTAAQKAFHAAMASGPRGGLRGPYVPLLHSPLLGGHVEQLGKHLRFSSSLDVAAVGIAALVAAGRVGCGHVWGAHAPRVIEAGVPAAVVAAIKAGDRAPPPQAPAGVAAVLTFCWATIDGKVVDDETYGAVAHRFGPVGPLDLTAAVGFYGMLSLIGNLATPDRISTQDPRPA